MGNFVAWHCECARNRHLLSKDGFLALASEDMVFLRFSPIGTSFSRLGWDPHCGFELNVILKPTDILQELHKVALGARKFFPVYFPTKHVYTSVRSAACDLNSIWIWQDSVQPQNQVRASSVRMRTYARFCESPLLYGHRRYHRFLGQEEIRLRKLSWEASQKLTMRAYVLLLATALWCRHPRP